MAKFLSSDDLRNRVLTYKHEDLQTVIKELNDGLYLYEVFSRYDWMTLGETMARKTKDFEEADYFALCHQVYFAVTTDGDLFKISVNVGIEYGLTDYDEFKAIINQYHEWYDNNPNVSVDLAEELKCRTYVKAIELEEVMVMDCHWLIRQDLVEFLKGAYKKGVIAFDTALAKMGFFD